MDAFESLGEFWIAGSQRRVPGMFRHDPSTGTELEVLGHLDEHEIDPSVVTRPLLHGELQTTRPAVGRCITMVRGLRTRSSFGGALSGEAWVADRVYAGDTWLDAADREIVAVSLEIAELLPWIGLSGLKPTGTYAVQYETPTSIQLGLPDASLTIESGARATHGIYEFSIVETGRIVIEPDVPTDASDCDRRWVSPLLWFLTTCIGRAPTVARTAYSIGTRDSLVLLSEGDPPDTVDFNPFETFIRPLREDLGTLLLRFFEIEAARNAFMRLYFPTVQYPPRYIEPRLLILLEALSLWSGDPESGLQWLSEAAATTLCLPDGVTPAQWVSELGHWNVRDSVGRVAFVHSERLRWVLHVALIEELGCPLDEVRDHPRLRWLRTLRTD